MRLRTALLLALAGSLTAQEPAAQAPPASDEPAPQSEYEGPAILSRGSAPSFRRGFENIRFRPFASVNGFYDTALTGASVDSNGKLSDSSQLGMEGALGAYVFHNFKRSVLGLEYRGTYRHYPSARYYNGTDQSLMLNFSHQATRRVAISFRENAGTYSRAFATTGIYGPVDPAFANIPTNDLLDNRTFFYSTMADVIYRKSARLSFDFGADGFLVRRRSSSLYGVTGARARGDMAYRVTRNSTIGVAYGFTHFEFNKGFGASDIHTVSLNYSRRLTRLWEFAATVGAARVETLGLANVTVDPLVTAITGQTQAVEAVYRVNYIPNLSGRLSRTFPRGSLDFSYTRATNPGNGIYLTSQYESISASLNYSGLRKWSFNLTSGYDSYGALAQTIGKYTSYRAGAGASYSLTRAVYFTTRLDARHADVGSLRTSTNEPFRRNYYRATIGLSFSPGEVPLALW